mgnify:CR=1 FL=1|tara:strand:+ start:713 stop:1915 length:1203 start_codon:yes stop_codon:yes gene_type:complete
MNLLTKLFKGYIKLVLFTFYAGGILTGFAFFIGPFALYADEGFTGGVVLFVLILWPLGYFITKFCYRGWVNTYRGHRKDWAEQGGNLYTKGMDLEKLVSDKFKLRNLNKENDDVTEEAKIYLSMLKEIAQDLELDPKLILKKNNTEELNQKYQIFKKAKEIKIENGYPKGDDAEAKSILSSLEATEWDHALLEFFLNETEKIVFDPQNEFWNQLKGALFGDFSERGFALKLINPKNFEDSRATQFDENLNISLQILDVYFKILNDTYLEFDESLTFLEFDENKLQSDLADLASMSLQYQTHFTHLFKEIRTELTGEKYGLSETDGKKVFGSFCERKICISMPKFYLQVVKGFAEEIKKTESKNKSKETFFYDSYTTSRGNTRYQLEVRLEDDLVTGIKDL